jgi:hypothetical protein
MEVKTKLPTPLVATLGKALRRSSPIFFSNGHTTCNLVCLQQRPSPLSAHVPPLASSFSLL